MRKPTLTLVLSTVLLAPMSFAADKRSEAAAESREGIFEVIRMYFGPVLGMVRGQIEFDGQVVSHNATKISQLAAMIADAYRYDTSDTDVETEALDAIWDNIEDFNEKAAALVSAADNLAVAGAADLAATRQAFGAVGQSCKGCHDDYRQQD
ncbi:MAG: cytochrome c [Pseudomonadota bacterium]